MGGLKKTKMATPQAGTEKGKEIRIVTKHVVTTSDLLKNPRALKLLYVISLAPNGISEKALMHLAYYVDKSSNGKLGYNFSLVGSTPVSKELLNDLTTLKYTGLVEVSLKNRKLFLTGLGKEFLNNALERVKDDVDTLKKAFEEAWPKVAPIDVEVSLKVSKR